MTGGGGGGGGQVNPPPPPASIFSKVVAIYYPLALLANMHDFIDNYIKTLLKFMGGGDLTTIENISLFYQFF
jgi:hypothetical protein